MLLPPDGAVTGWAALRLLRGNFFDGLLPDGVTRMPVPLCIGPDVHRKEQDGVRYLRDRLEPDEVTTIHGIRVVRANRATFDAIRLAPNVREGTVAIDMAAAAEITSVRRVQAYTDLQAGTKGVRQVRAALELADEDSRSPNETRMRWMWRIDAGLPRPLANQPVWDRRGRLLGYADLLDPVAGVVGEFDGADHRGAVRHTADLSREGRFRDCLLEFFRVTGLDLAQRQLVVRRMLSARSRAKWLPEAERPWTITPPPGWKPEPSLDQILDERDFQREMHEKWLREGDPDLRELLGEG